MLAAAAILVMKKARLQVIGREGFDVAANDPSNGLISFITAADTHTCDVRQEEMHRNPVSQRSSA